MIKKDCRKILKLTQYILEQYWQRNLEPLLDYLHPDVLWIGSMDEEYIHGKDRMLERIDENQNEMPFVYLDHQEYEIVQNGSRDCVVVGRYRAYTKPESGLLLSEKQRVTFVWEKSKDQKLLIKHIHLSNVLHIQEEDERFPTRAGKENYEYVQRIMAERSQNAIITVKDDDRINRVLNFSDILYVMSDHNYILIKVSNENAFIRVRENLSVFIKKLPAYFIQVSRSYCVNKRYIKSFDGKNLKMMDDHLFKVPVKAIKKVNEQMNIQ